jgi:hypothetical protein
VRSVWDNVFYLFSGTDFKELDEAIKSKLVLDPSGTGVFNLVCIRMVGVVCEG